jgi:hypothetical protein
MLPLSFANVGGSLMAWTTAVGSFRHCTIVVSYEL